MIIPFFIPHAGCPHQCVFCNQKSITGRKKPVDSSAIPDTVNGYLNTATDGDAVQIAFYGGSFTALPSQTQKAYLEAARPFIESGHVRSIRVSTRPDCISTDILSLLGEYHVTTIELGAQSMDDRVLALSGRGHTAADTLKAVKLLRERGFAIGLQLMPGLPGDSFERFLDSVDKSIALKPDFVRLYPALVIKDTPLEGMHRFGSYAPLSLDEAIMQCRDAMVRFERTGIEVIRVGLQPTEELERCGAIIAGPYHPAIRQLVESSVFLDKMRMGLAENKGNAEVAVFFVNPRDVSAAIGQKRSNVGILRREFGLKTVSILPDPRVSKGAVTMEIGLSRLDKI